MTSQKRPAGLIVLAVLNFVLVVPSLLGALVIYGFATEGFDGRHPIAFSDTSTTVHLAFAACLAIALLLLVSGIGYLRLRPMGRVFGNLFAVVSLVAAGCSLGRGTGLVQAIVTVCALYPIATAILINTIYKPRFTADQLAVPVSLPSA